MNANFLAISGWIIAFLSLIVNFLQLINNKKLKKQVQNVNQKVGDNASAKQQVNFGSGDNYMADRDIKVKKQ